MIELYTPLEIIEKAVQIIETERKVQKLQQKELALKANVPLPTYKQFIYSYKISLENIIKLFIALRLSDGKLWWKEKTYKNFAKLSCNLTNAEYETIIDECSEAIRLTKNEILEFIKKYPKQKIFLDSLIECWSENLSS